MGVLKRDSEPQRGRGLGLGLSIFENLESLASRQCGNEISRGRGSPCTSMPWTLFIMLSYRPRSLRGTSAFLPTSCLLGRVLLTGSACRGVR